MGVWISPFDANEATNDCDSWTTNSPTIHGSARLSSGIKTVLDKTIIPCNRKMGIVCLQLTHHAA